LRTVANRRTPPEALRGSPSVPDPRHSSQVGFGRLRTRTGVLSGNGALLAIRAIFRPKALLIAENLCLRQRLVVLQHRYPRPCLSDADRRFWILASRWFSNWRNSLLIVKTETVLQVFVIRLASIPLHHHPPRNANQRITTDSSLQPIVTLFVARSPWGATGAPLCQQSIYSKRTRSSPTTTAKGCGLRHFCMFCWPNQNDGVFDADSPGPARQWSMSPWAKSSARTFRGSRMDFRRISPPYRHGSQHGERCAGALVDDARCR
jgi:hypothetical protein